MIRKQPIMQFLNIKLGFNTMLIIMLLCVCTTSVSYASSKPENLKKQEVTKQTINETERIKIIEQLNIERQNNELYEKFNIEKVEFDEFSYYEKAESAIELEKINSQQEQKQVKTLTRDTEKSLSAKVEEITPKVEKMTTTAYCACSKCCGKADGITASEEQAMEWYTVAAGTDYKFGTIIYIPELSDKPNGGWFVVQDRGSAISNNRLDVFFNTHEIANEFGLNEFDVYIYEL